MSKDNNRFKKISRKATMPKPRRNVLFEGITSVTAIANLATDEVALRLHDRHNTVILTLAMGDPAATELYHALGEAIAKVTGSRGHI